MGGEILFVEATSMPGSGKLALTGQLGDVMKESVQIALAWLRSRMPISAFAGTSGVDFEKRDFHVHVPAGAIPKDGPSAGVAMLVTLASLLTGKAVNPKLAMTGEITLRGAVMPVGGIKEKVIAAHRAGIEKVLLPSKNQKDLREIPDEVRKAMTIQWVDTAADVLSAALGIEVGSSPLEGEGAMPVGERKRPATPGLA
jgi:ATP-dependent Lon protease